MKIFVGGPMPPQQERLRRRFPTVDFLFATKEDARTRWVARAKQAELALVDRGRCDHTVVNMLRSRGIEPQFVDGAADIQRKLEEVVHADQSI